MPKCGFCKQEISIKDFVKGMGKGYNTEKTMHWRKKVCMFCCPHCDSVLGFGFS